MRGRSEGGNSLEESGEGENIAEYNNHRKDESEEMKRRNGRAINCTLKYFIYLLFRIAGKGSIFT